MPYKVGDIVEYFEEKYRVEGKVNLSQLLLIVRLSDEKRRIAHSSMVYLIEPVEEGGMNDPIKLDTTEIQRLRGFLDKNNINYEVGDWGESADGFWEGYNLHVLSGDIRYSFLLSKGSYGREIGLIEFYNFNDEPTGWLTADECMEIVKRELKVEEPE